MIDKIQQFQKISFFEFESAEPINESGVRLKILDISLASFDNRMFEVKYEILSGSRKGSTLLDYFHYIPFKSTSWKMPKFLRAVGIEESGEYNFNGFITSELTVDLVVGHSKEDADRVYQNLNYIPRSAKKTTSVFVKPNESEIISKEVAEKVMSAAVKPEPVKVAPSFNETNYISSDNTGLVSDDDLPF